MKPNFNFLMNTFNLVFFITVEYDIYDLDVLKFNLQLRAQGHWPRSYNYYIFNDIIDSNNLLCILREDESTFIYFCIPIIFNNAH